MEDIFEKLNIFIIRWSVKIFLIEDIWKEFFKTISFIRETFRIILNKYAWISFSIKIFNFRCTVFF